MGGWVDVPSLDDRDSALHALGFFWGERKAGA